MAILLPTTDVPVAITPRLVSRRRDLEPTFGGPTSRVRRLGSKWAFDIELPPLYYDPAMAWVAALTSAEADTVILPIPQPEFDVGAPGAPLVNGAGQLGSFLSLDGFTPEYVARAGQWFNLVGTTGQKYLYQVATETVASGGATAAMPINPMIRRSPADNSAVEFVSPVIEGFLSGRETSWTVDRGMFVGLSFTITERE
ncbi:hypothetical protein [Phenylobacterium sp.]|uniref:hypothetical protein n=1 Tax=Phenylobacterium sp. TaxID=1871053 RepID=UPI0028119A06|nr:hypothetical protein [Phenylobacterium sp.]